MNESVWQKNANLPQFSELKGDIKTDVLIIGGGLAGILTAFFLKEAGIDYILVEKEKICGGTTKNTTGKITFQHGFIYDKLISALGTERAKMYLEANRNATLKYRELAKELSCDYEIKDNYVYSLDNRQKAEKEAAALEKLGCKTEFLEAVELPLKIAGAVRVKGQAQFNPIKFVSQISNGLNIYENTFVTELGENFALTKNGRITAKEIIVATHFPFLNKHGSYFLKLYQHRSYVLALKNAPSFNGMYVDDEKTGLSFRNYGDLLLLGGGGHRTGKQGGNWKELSAFARVNFPKASEEYRWAVQDCMSLDDIPYIGNYSKSTPNLYVMSGFNKWGMTGAMTAAMVITDMLIGKNNPFSEVFNPSRSILKPQLLVNGFEATANLLTPTKKRCPHLGCALKWNPAEHSWDCPCHGSRFTKSGRLLENPANGDLKNKKDNSGFILKDRK